MNTLPNITEDVIRFVATAIPEKLESFNEMVQANNVIFAQDGRTQEIDFKTAFGTIIVPLQCQRRLWAHCFAYCCSFVAFDERHRTNTASSFPELIEAADELLRWAAQTDLDARDEDQLGTLKTCPIQPDSLPMISSTADFVRQLTNATFDFAITFIITHELGHIVLRHSPHEGKPEDEYEADEWATQFLLDQVTDEAEQLKRQLGIAVALIWLLSLDFYRLFKSDSHPATWDRVPVALRTALGQEVHAIWGLTAVAIVIHFQANDVLDSIGSFSPTAQTVCDLLTTIAARNQTLG